MALLGAMTLIIGIAKKSLLEIGAYFPSIFKNNRSDVQKRDIQTSRSIDWFQQLPPDIVMHQIIPLVDYKSWLRSICVSKSWKEFIDEVQPPPDIPWIWLTDPECNSSLISPFSFSAYSLLKNKMRVGSAAASHRQYLLCIDPPPSSSPPSTPRNITIHNPFNGQTFRLPPQPLRTPLIDLGAVLYLQRTNSTMVLAAAIIGIDGSIYSCQFPNKKWERSDYHGRVEDVILLGGLLYLISLKGTIFRFDFVNHPTKEPTIFVPHTNYCSPPLYKIPTNGFSYYLVESCYGELLIVTRYSVPESMGHTVFTVHRHAGESNLVQVNDLGDQVLFVGRGCSKSARFNGSHAWQSDFFIKNSIYFFHKDEKSCTYRLGRFTLGDFECNWISYFHSREFPASFCPIWITPAPK